MKRDLRTAFGPGRLWTAIACVSLTALIVAHHAGAQSIDSAVSPAVSPDTAELANRSLKLDFSAAPAVLRIVLPAADAASTRSDAEARDHRPLQIGFPRTIPSEYRGDLSPLIDWAPLDDGSIAGAVSVTSPGAQALRAAIRAELGSGGEIRFFEGSAGEENTEQLTASQDFPVITREDFYENGEPEVLWSPTVEGDTIGIEITLPSREAVSDFSLSIEQVSHIYVPMGSLGDVPEELECPNHIDVQCRVGSFSSNYDSAVARIVYVENGGTYLCSGTLLNDAVDSTGIPYFLTANHCVSTGTVARTVEARWFHQLASCGGASTDSRGTTTHGGADLLETSVAQDSTLLRFKRSLPGELIYSGWSADSISHPTPVYGIHHPDGEVKKFSAGRTAGHADRTVCEDPENEIGCFTVRNAIRVTWSDGTTEGGSSGSGLFRGQHLIGALSGGPAGVCTNKTSTYGSFQDFFPKISRWLGSDNTTSPSALVHTLPFVPPASNVEQQGFVRIINNSNRAGEVTITAIDDEGRPANPVTLSLEARAGAHFNSQDLESGNSEKGLFGRAGNGYGNWRLELSTDLEIEHLAYIRTMDGFVTNMHEVAAETPEGSNRYHVPFFNPGKNRNQESKLRLINPGSSSARIEITGVDDDGLAPPRGAVSLDLGAGMARILTAYQLENGGSGLSGDLGAGEGKWRLSVSADRPIQVMSLLELPTGHLTNLSRGQDGVAVPPPPPPTNEPDLVVESPSVSDSSLNTGQSFTFRATVRNQGGGRSAVTTLRYYRSSDMTISMSDTGVGTDAVGGLSASDTSAESIVLTAPSSAGTYYYGACVDTVAGESDTGNNCSAAVRVDVSGGSGSCEVTLNRRGPDETVSIRLSDARRVGVGTLSDPVVVRVRMDHPADVDSYRIDLREAGRLVILSVGNLDTEAVLLDSHCTEAGVVIGDVGLEDPATFGPTNFNFAAGGDLNAGTYYLVVNEWQGRVGAYSLGIAVTDSSGAVETGASHLIRGWNSLRDRLESDGIGGQN